MFQPKMNGSTFVCRKVTNDLAIYSMLTLIITSHFRYTVIFLLPCQITHAYCNAEKYTLILVPGNLCWLLTANSTLSLYLPHPAYPQPVKYNKHFAKCVYTHKKTVLNFNILWALLVLKKYELFFYSFTFYWCKITVMCFNDFQCKLCFCAVMIICNDDDERIIFLIYVSITNQTHPLFIRSTAFLPEWIPADSRFKQPGGNANSGQRVVNNSFGEEKWRIIEKVRT